MGRAWYAFSEARRLARRATDLCFQEVASLTGDEAHQSLGGGREVIATVAPVAAGWRSP